MTICLLTCLVIVRRLELELEELTLSSSSLSSEDVIACT